MLDVAPRPNRTVQTTCPLCGKTALSVSRREGRELYHCHYGCPQADLWRVLRGGAAPPQRLTPPAAPRANLESVRGYALKLWQDSLPAEGTPVQAYLAGRGLTGPIPAALRYLPDHLHKPSGTRCPCMLAAVRNVAGDVVAVHRTYLVRDGHGKAPVMPAKMTLSAIGGYACHLAEAGEDLAVAEGIETALSVMTATGIPAWAALSAGGIRALLLPPFPLASHVTIAADNDPVGLQAAHDAAHRWREEGRHVRIAIPPTADTDFNDLLQEGRA